MFKHVSRVNIVGIIIAIIAVLFAYQFYGANSNADIKSPTATAKMTIKASIQGYVPKDSSPKKFGSVTANKGLKTYKGSLILNKDRTDGVMELNLPAIDAGLYNVRVSFDKTAYSLADGQKNSNPRKNIIVKSGQTAEVAFSFIEKASWSSTSPSPAPSSTVVLPVPNPTAEKMSTVSVSMSISGAPVVASPNGKFADVALVKLAKMPSTNETSGGGESTSYKGEIKYTDTSPTSKAMSVVWNDVKPGIYSIVVSNYDKTKYSLVVNNELAYPRFLKVEAGKSYEESFKFNQIKEAKP